MCTVFMWVSVGGVEILLRCWGRTYTRTVRRCIYESLEIIHMVAYIFSNKTNAPVRSG